MEEHSMILVCKDKQIAEDICKILTASGKIDRAGIEVWEEKTWDVKRKTGPVKDKILFVGDIKDTEALGCFINIRYERWGIRYGVNSRYALITTDTIYVKDSARYNAFMTDFNDAVGPVLAEPSKITPEGEAALDPSPAAKANSAKAAKVIGTVGLAVATGGASLAAQKLIDDNKTLAEKNVKLCLFGAWHFAGNCLEEFLED